MRYLRRTTFGIMWFTVQTVVKPITIGENHRGYLGYRNVTNNSTISDDGEIDEVVDNWNETTIPTIANPNFNSTFVCHDSSKSTSS
jgi:hypothetical protein